MLIKNQRTPSLPVSPSPWKEVSVEPAVCLLGAAPVDPHRVTRGNALPIRGTREVIARFAINGQRRLAEGRNGADPNISEVLPLPDVSAVRRVVLHLQHRIRARLRTRRVRGRR